MVAVPQESLMRWTAADVRRMIGSGAFAHPERFEDLRQDVRAEDVLLVVEVADTSLKTGQTVKAALCAAHGVPEYQIRDDAGRKGESWGEAVILTGSGEFTPLGGSGSLQVADLLPDPAVG